MDGFLLTDAVPKVLNPNKQPNGAASESNASQMLPFAFDLRCCRLASLLLLLFLPC